MDTKVLKRGIFQRIFGLCATRKPADEGCWTVSGNTIEIDLSRAPELSEPWGAIRLEKKNLAERVLVLRAEDGTFHAFKNKCSHAGRRLDPVPETATVQCCSVGKSTFDYDGQPVGGTSKKPVAVHAVRTADGRVVVEL